MTQRKTVIKNLAEVLASLLGPGRVITDHDLMDMYSRDETGDLESPPDLVVRAYSTEDVKTTLRACREAGVPVVPRGTGTGVTGGSVPVLGGVVLSLEKMNRIIEIDTDNMVAVVEPGVITGDLQRAVREKGLMYPPDPASLDSCSIGGNIAESAGGPRAVKYGTTKDYVLGLEFVLPDGSAITTGGKFVKNATGFNLAGLLVGSEGTLAVVTKIYLRLIPSAPYTLDLLVPYRSMTDAVQTVHRIISGRIIPAALEFLEEGAIKLVGRYLGEEMPFPEAAAHLLIQLDGATAESLDRELERMAPLLGETYEHALVADSPSLSDRIWRARRAIREALNSESPDSLAEDTVVPRSEIPGFLNEINAYFINEGLETVMFGHAGDGNVHIHVLRGGLPDEKWEQMKKSYKKKIYSIALKHNGTISGEHGIGCSRKDYLPLALSRDELELMKRIKKAFDPDNLLNPGKIL